MTDAHVHRLFRFGVLAEHARTPDALRETARRAEAAGYATLLLRDHFIEAPFGHQLAPLVSLATVAAATTTLRVGTLVLANDYRHPVHVAKEFASLDCLSDGRVELGLGAGFSVPEYQQAGLPFDSARTRIERLAEAVQVINGLWAEAPFSFAGQHYTLDQLDSYPKPHQRPRPPILIAGAGRRILQVAAREADAIGLLAGPISSGYITDEDPTERLAERLDERIDWIRQAAGERFAQIELSIVAAITIATDPLAAAGAVAQRRGWHTFTPAQILDMPAQLIGPPEQLVELVLARRARYGLSYVIVSDAALDVFAPIVARLAGQ